MSWGRDNLIGAATCYGQKNPGIESSWKRDCPHPSELILGTTQIPIKWVHGNSRG